jgi:hypothetical protein
VQSKCKGEKPACPRQSSPFVMTNKTVYEQKFLHTHRTQWPSDIGKNTIYLQKNQGKGAQKT